MALVSMDLRTLIEVSVGLVALALGTAVAAVYIFRGETIVVTVGVLLAAFGHDTIHYTFHGESMLNLTPNAESEPMGYGVLVGAVTIAGLLAFGCFLIAYGFTIGAQAALSSVTPSEMATSGSAAVSGYIVGNFAIHGELL